MEAVSLIAKQGLRAEISSCARGTRGDIEAVAKSGADSIHLVIPTSDIHLCKLNRDTGANAQNNRRLRPTCQELRLDS